MCTTLIVAAFSAALFLSSLAACGPTSEADYRKMAQEQLAQSGYENIELTAKGTPGELDFTATREEGAGDMFPRMEPIGDDLHARPKPKKIERCTGTITVSGTAVSTQSRTSVSCSTIISQPVAPAAPTCAREHPEVCYAQAHEQGDPAKRMAMLETGCDAGHMLSCNDLGVYLIAGEDVATDVTRAIALYRKACDGKEALACGNLGKVYRFGKGVPVDVAVAFEALDKACALGDAETCSMAGTMLINGEGVAADPIKARSHFEKACAAKDRDGCANLGQALITGRGGAPDGARGARLLQETCDAGFALACSNLAQAMDGGMVDGATPEMTLAVLEKGCRAGARDLCEIAAQGSLKLEPSNHAKVLPLLAKGCDLDSAWCCMNLGIAAEKGFGVAADPAKATAAFERACKLGIQEGCDKIKPAAPP